MTTRKLRTIPISDFVKIAWVAVLAFIGIIYWAARQDSALTDIKYNKQKIETLENRITVLESGLGKLQMKIDDIKEDLSLIKSAVLK